MIKSNALRNSWSIIFQKFFGSSRFLKSIEDMVVRMIAHKQIQKDKSEESRKNKKPAMTTIKLLIL